MVILLLIALVGLSGPVPAGEVTGVWLSPDWFFPGTRRYSEAEIRRTARETMEALSAQGVNTVFMETFLRGYSIAPFIQREAHQAQVVPYSAGGIPVYPHLQWNYRVEADTVIDPLQIFIQEATLEGIEVHAWVHMFYWKMDNTEVMLAWHNGPSFWNELMVEYLREEAGRLSGNPAAAPATVAMMLEAAALFETTSDARQLEAILRRYKVDPEGRPMGVLLRQAMRAGATRPDFLLIHSREDPFPAPRGKRLRPIYVNPAHPKVRETLKRVCRNLAEGHPGLAGIHLDHVRYPVDGQGLPEKLEVQDGTINYFDPTRPMQAERYEIIHRLLGQRRDLLHTLVNEIDASLPRGTRLSAAVLPLYYRDRDNGRFRISGYDFASQDWQTWNVDFVVPMMYEFHPYLIRNMLKLFATQMGEDAIAVYPGVSRLQMARTSLDTGSWVFFDLDLARDVKLEKEQTEDLDFGPE